jgi:putative protease
MKRRPEILAPAGDRDALSAALAAGADAVYFGLDDGFNARARADNFPSTDLAPIVAQIHRAGARAYVTLNTLIFEPELATVEELIRRVAAAGVDAIIVQDPAVARIAGAICPALEVHASTQMTASSPLAAELLRPLGLRRVVVPRELSVTEIAAYAAGTDLPLEVFIHGALCVSWSGQCLTSESWGGRSANRGQCAQSCRLPYQLVVDGTLRELGEIAYLLSPMDLVGLDAVPALAEIGVASLKIEGRLKGPHYVAATVAAYQRAGHAAVGAPPPPLAPGVLELFDDPSSLEIAYSRGRSPGFLGGTDHQRLVEGRFPRHRGAPLGRVVAIDGWEVEVVVDPTQRPWTGGRGLAELPPEPAPTAPLTPTAPLELRAGMGVVFDGGHPDEAEQGGPVFAAAATRDRDGRPGYRLRFGEPGPDLSRVAVGDWVWVSSDPRVGRAGERAAVAGRGALGRLAIDLVVRGEVGAPLVVTATVARRGGGPATVEVHSRAALAAARAAGLDAAMLGDKLGALGGTVFHLGALAVDGLAPGLHLPVSELKELRRAIVAGLEPQLEVPREVAPASVLDGLRAAAPAIAPDDGPPQLVPLCRTDAQLDAALAAGVTELELDWMELVGLGRAVERARAAGVRVGVATVRVQKPGEERIDAHLARLLPDDVLIRSWGSLAAFLAQPAAARPRLHGDFSLNVTNSITARWVLAHGLASVTASHDLDRDQLLALVDAAPRGRIAVTIHHHIPTFHTEHCVYAHLLSAGRDYRSCGRPCEQHEVSLRDRVGMVHPVVVDVGCRNTVFNAQAQSAAALVPTLLARGVRRFRLELVRESASETGLLIAAYHGLLAGRHTPAEVVRQAAVHEQFGVTRGTMRTLTVLR